MSSPGGEEPTASAAEGATDSGTDLIQSAKAEAPRPRGGARRTMLELAVFVGLIAAVSAWQERHLLPTRGVAPAFELEGVDGARLSLESLRGKRVVIHFWATWCGVCQREFGALNAVQEGLAPDQVVLSIVADSDDAEHVRQVMADEHIRYPVLLGTAEVLRAFRVDTFPTNYYIDRQGRITSHTVGMSTRWSVRARLGLLG